MFTISFRVKKKNLVALLGAAVLVMAGAVALTGAPEAAQTFSQKKKVSCSTAAEGAAWLREQGWEVEDTSTGQMEVVVPPQFDGIYESYNDLQKSQGFDLAKYRGKTVTKYTFLVKNYPQEEDGVAANLLVYEDRLVAADLCSLRLGGFLKEAAAPKSKK